MRTSWAAKAWMVLIVATAGLLGVWVTSAAGAPLAQITEFSTGLQPSNGSAPFGIAAGPDGNLWFTDLGSTREIGRITPSGTITEFSTGLQPSNGSAPSDIAAGSDGNLWFNDRGTTPEIGRITPSGAITEFSTGLQPSNGSNPFDIAAGPDGNLWFTDEGTTSEIGRITPSGAITEFSTGLQPSNGSVPIDIAPGSDGNLWFTDQGTTREIGQVGAAAPAASVRSPSVTGSGQQGTQQVCQGDQWAQWAGQPPSYSAFSFDGYQWLRDGSPIAGQTGQAYTPTTGDVGHGLSCTVTVTYPLFNVTASATSAAVTVIPQASGPQGPTGSSGPAGSNGSQGPTGQRGPQGPPGKVELVTCRTVTKIVNHKHKKVKKCTARLVSGPVKFTAQNADARAVLSRAGAIYATGYARLTGHGAQVRLLAARRLAPGRYLLTLTRHNRLRRITTRYKITIR